MVLIKALIDGNRWSGAPWTGPAIITTEYGVPRNNSVGFHTGLDGVGQASRQLVAIAPGTIEQVLTWREGMSRTGTNGGYGNALFVRHDDGTRSRYCHLAEFSDKVQRWIERGFPASERPRFAEGEEIAVEGNTGHVLGWNGSAWVPPPPGNREWGRHLHFELHTAPTARHPNGVWVNPRVAVGQPLPDPEPSPAPLRSPELLQAMAVASLARAVHEQAGIAGARVVADQADRLVAMLED